MAGATSRAIARAGGVNQALIFYHFGSLDSLLLAALDATSGERLERYRTAVEEAETVEELLAVVVRARAEDRETGHTTIVAQMIAGSVAHPELAPEIIARMRTVGRPLQAGSRQDRHPSRHPSPLPLRELAYAVATFTSASTLLTHLAEARRIDALFSELEQLAPVLSQFSAEIPHPSSEPPMQT